MRMPNTRKIRDTVNTLLAMLDLLPLKERRKVFKESLAAAAEETPGFDEVLANALVRMEVQKVKKGAFIGIGKDGMLEILFAIGVKVDEVRQQKEQEEREQHDAGVNVWWDLSEHGGTRS